MKEMQANLQLLQETIFAAAERIKKVRLQILFFSYILSLALSILALLGSVLLSSFYHQLIPFLIFPAVTLSAWYGNAKTGIFTATMSTAGLYTVLLFRFPSLLSQYAGVEFTLIFVCCILVCIALNKTKQEDTIRVYQQREKMYAKLLFDAGVANKEIHEQLKARDEFLSIVSHELKTPLTSMLLQLQSALYNITNVSLANFSIPNLLKMLESAQDQSERLSRMINDLLNVSLIATGRFDLEKEKIDLGVLTGNVLQQFEEKIQRDGYNVSFEPKQSVLGIWDKLRIEQVITNLLSNALKYGSKKPVAVSVATAGQFAVLTITDHGIGIPADQKKLIFNRFKRAVPAKHYQGFGVGLYITLQIIKAHNGNVDVKSSKRHGTSFIVKLPLAVEKKPLLKNISAAKN